MLRRITVLVGALIAISCRSSAQSTAPRSPDNAETQGAACGLAMTAETREKVLGEFVCKQAINFGAGEDSLVPSGPEVNAEDEAQRTSGVTAIHPPQSEATAMVRRGVKQAGAEVILCLSKTGVSRKIFFAQFSEFPKWNQKIFETMRTWRYRPAVDAKGAAVPVCTGVTFLYLPQR